MSQKGVKQEAKIQKLKEPDKEMRLRLRALKIKEDKRTLPQPVY